MSSTASIEVIAPGNPTRFTNAGVNDMTIYTKTDTQKVHIGTKLNAASTVEVTYSNVTFNTNTTTAGVIRLSN